MTGVGIVLLSLSSYSFAQEVADPLLEAVSREASDKKPLLRGARIALDASTRHMVSTSDGDWDGLSAIGIDYLQRLSSSQMDWGEILLQGFLLGAHQWEEKPPFIEEETHIEPQLRLAYLDLTGPFQGKLALRIGHIGIPYGIGLPYTINTNGTLQQFIGTKNIGYKLDYGVSLHGELAFLEYEVMLGRGTGMDFINDKGTWLVSGRVGSPERRMFVGGLSAYRANQLTPAGVLERLRLGIDGRYYGPIDLLVEASYGTDAGTTPVFNIIEQVSYRTGSDAFMAYIQHRVLYTGVGQGGEPMQSIVPGVRIFPANSWTVEVNYDRAFRGVDGAPPRQILAAQVRTRWAFGGLL